MKLPKLLLLLTLPLYILDQATKAWTVSHIAPPWSQDSSPIKVIPDVFHWVRWHNQGIAFGIGNGSTWAPVVFLIVPVIALVLIRIFWKKGAFDHFLSRIAVALLLCGIFGNLTDRLVQGFLLAEVKDGSFWHRLSSGYVVDFISVKLPLYGWWPAFNVADSCISVAAALLFIGGLRDEKSKALAEKKAA